MTVLVPFSIRRFLGQRQLRCLEHTERRNPKRKRLKATEPPICLHYVIFWSLVGSCDMRVRELFDGVGFFFVMGTRGNTSRGTESGSHGTGADISGGRASSTSPTFANRWYCTKSASVRRLWWGREVASVRVRGQELFVQSEPAESGVFAPCRKS